MLDKGAYTEFLRNTQGCESYDVAECVGVIDDFTAFAGVAYGEGAEDFSVRSAVDYIVHRRDHDANISRTIGILTDYAFYLRNGELISELVLLRDAWNVMNRTSELIKKHGGDSWERVFGGLRIPEIGATLDEMSDFTREIEKRMLDAMPRDNCEGIMSKNAHSWEPEWDWDENSKLLEAKTIDEYIEMKHAEFIKELEGYRDRGEFFFTQEIDDQVIEFARDNLITVRNGNKILHTRAPYLMKQYINAADRKMKRYYACHCPWKRNSILQEEGSLSSSMCYCCLGHAKKSFDLAFGRELNGRVVKTMMDEDCVLCTYEYDIPDDIMERYT